MKSGGGTRKLRNNYSNW